MKILQLRFKNLNSLYGEWFIDFSAPDYVSNGIFAITGPTGSGKSTILDAVCLALYGETPRLAKVVKSSNEIMSRKTGECFAEVVFESQRGRFRCHWSQRRAKNSPNGNLQEPAHEISNADTGEVIEAKKSLVVGVVEDKTGMDFLRFTRSILLAQGGFSAFLQATPGERSPILEQITGTEVYSIISSRIFERQREEKSKFDTLNAEVSGIRVLLPEEEALIKQELTAKTSEEARISEKHLESSKALQWLTGIESLRSELFSIKAEAMEIETRVAAFKPQREKLELAVKAAELDSDYTALTMTRQQQSSDAEALKISERSLPGLEASLLEHEKHLQDSEKKVSGLKVQQNEMKPLLQQVRSLDVKISEKARNIESAEAERRQVESQIEENELGQKQVRKSHQAATGELEKVNGFLSANARDEALVSQYSAISELARGLQPLAEELEKRREELEKEKKQSEKTRKNLKAREKDGIAARIEHEAAQKEKMKLDTEFKLLLDGKLLREYRSEYDALLREAGFIRTIAAYEEDRKKLLEDGKPCPLCGAIEHPFAQGNIPELDGNQRRTAELASLIKKAEAIEAEVGDLQKAEHDLAKKLVDAENKLIQAGQADETARKVTVEKQALLTETENKNVRAREAILEKFRGHGIHEIPGDDIAALLVSLQTRLDAWQKHQTRKSEVESRLQQLALELKSFEGIVATLNNSLTAKKAVFADMQQAQQVLQASRHELFGARKPDEEERSLDKLISQAEKAEKLGRDKRDQAKTLLEEAKTLIKKLQESIINRTRELDSLQKAFVLNLGRKGFADEAAFTDCRLSSEQRNALAEQAKNLDARRTETATRLNDREAFLQKELQLNLATVSIDELRVVVAEYAAAVKILGEEMGGLKQKIADNQKSIALISNRKTEIDRQGLECRKWDSLNALIGAKDGQKFRNFAQGLTFGIMVNHANQQLKKMSGRYLLTRDPEQLLELKVVDNYQAGEVRSTKNLSGGESFIVSLSLALGLSKMASKKVRVDSLFLDEGFGTLDEDALQVALDTLAGLQQDGKLIGVISHVAMLKERISTQINVIGSNTGRSRIEGPGVIKK